MIRLSEFNQTYKNARSKIFVRLNGQWKEGKSKKGEVDNIIHVLQTMTAMAAQQNTSESLIAMNIQTTKKGRTAPLSRGGGGDLRDGDIWIELHDHTY